MQTVRSNTLMEHWLLQQEDKKKHPEKYRLKSTGLRSLDNALGGGVEYGNFVIYGGRQKIGKSMLLQHTAKTFGRSGEPFAFFSAEMTNMAMATRLVCSVAGLDKNRIRRIEWNEAEWISMQNAAAEISLYPAYWNYGFNTLEHITKTLDRIEKEENVVVRIVFVDYFQLMSHPGRKVRSEELEMLSHGMKQLALNRKMPMIIFAAAQLNRQSIRNQIVDANSFMGTGALERDMDVGVIVNEVKDDMGKILPQYRDLVVVGSRETSIDTCRVRFNGSTASFADVNESLQEVDMNFWS